MPIDPSKRLRPAREYALSIAKRLESSLTVTFVSNPAKTGTVMASFETSQGLETLGNRQLNQFVDGIEDVEVTSVMKTGKRRYVIADMIREGIADTLVLGPFRSLITRWFTGSEVERILAVVDSDVFVVRGEHPLPGPGSPALVVFDVDKITDRGLKKIEEFSRKFSCDLEFLHLGPELFDGAEAMDKAVSELRNRLGEGFHVTSTTVPLSFFRTRKAITNSVIKSEGARIVLLPFIEESVSDILLHQLVLSASVPVCVLK